MCVLSVQLLDQTSLSLSVYHSFRLKTHKQTARLQNYKKKKSQIFRKPFPRTYWIGWCICGKYVYMYSGKGGRWELSLTWGICNFIRAWFHFTGESARIYSIPQAVKFSIFRSIIPYNALLRFFVDGCVNPQLKSIYTSSLSNSSILFHLLSYPWFMDPLQSLPVFLILFSVSLCLLLLLL